MHSLFFHIMTNMKTLTAITIICVLGINNALARGTKICFEAESAEKIETPMCLVSNDIENISGAAISASITYTVTVVYQWIVFHKVTGIRLSEFLLDKTDWTWAKDEFRILISKNKGVADGK